jgi:hypothetical protein
LRRKGRASAAYFVVADGEARGISRFRIRAADHPGGYGA